MAATIVQNALTKSNCAHAYSISFLWSYFGSTCITSSQSNQLTITASGSITTTYEVANGAIIGQEVFGLVSANLPFQIAFPAQALVNITSLQIFSAYGLFADISAIEITTTVQAGAPSVFSGVASGQLTMETGIEWPFQTLSPVISSIPGVVFQSPTVSNSNSVCTGTANSVCRQFWTFSYTAGSPACSLLGMLADTVLECHSIAGRHVLAAIFNRLHVGRKLSSSYGCNISSFIHT
jgi:hypothetical protein